MAIENGANPPVKSTVSLSDILTAAKNLVSAVANAASTYQTISGSSNAAAISASTIVKASPGVLVTVSVTTAGSAAGIIYDSATSATSRPVMSVPDAIGIYPIHMPMRYGILAVPGSGQVFTVGYS